MLNKWIENTEPQYSVIHRLPYFSIKHTQQSTTLSNQPYSAIKKTQICENAIFLLKTGSYYELYNEVIKLDLYDFEERENNSFTKLKGLYLDAFHDQKFSDIAEDQRGRQIAAHYAKLTRDLLYSYLFTTGHPLIYYKHLITDEIWPILLAMFVPVIPSALRKFKSPVSVEKM